MLSGRTVLVTGGSGFIGAHLVRRLLSEGAEVWALSRSRSPKRSVLESVPGIRLISVERFGTDELKQRLGVCDPEVVFHLAAYGVGRDERDREEMLRGNVDLLAHLLLALADRRPRLLLHTGSCSEYASSHEPLPLSEDHPVRPATLYGAAKAASVLFGNALAAELGIPLVTLRLFGVFGPGEAPQRLVPYLVQCLKRGTVASLTPGEQVRDFLYIDDVVDAFISAAGAAQLPPFHAYNVSSGVPVTVRTVGEVVCEEMEGSSALLGWGRRPYPMNEPLYLVGDSHRFRSATGWSPRVSLREGIRRVIANG